jgi:hypothetical protein
MTSDPLTGVFFMLYCINKVRFIKELYASEMNDHKEKIYVRDKSL